MRYSLLSFAILMGGLSTVSAENIELIYDNMVYSNSIKSVQVIVNGEISSVPILRLNSKDYFVIKFDDIENIERDLFYRFIHCDRNWQKSNINEIDYVDGFNDDRLREFQFSINTKVTFTHYWARFPNRDFNFKISGNYILYIYDKYDKEVPLLTRRIMVSEEMVTPNMSFVMPNDVSNLQFKHQINVSVNVGKVRIINPMASITLSIIQNGNWLTGIYNLTPKFFANNELTFDQFGEINFWAGREFRFFDTRTLMGRGIRLMEIDRGGRVTEAYTFPDESRYNQPYLFRFDFNGNFFINNHDRPGFYDENISRPSNSKNIDSLKQVFTYRNFLQDGFYRPGESDLMSDYVYVNMTYKKKFEDGDLYIFGALTDWQLLPKYKFEYDDYRGIYVGRFLFKQGYTEFQYVFVKDNEPDFISAEGSWQDTENDYTALIYMRQPTDIYDRLIGAGRINSLRNR